MFENNREDISREELEKIYFSFFTKSIRVGVIGGGKAAAIKVKTLTNKNIYVEVLAKEFSEEILSINSNKLILVKSTYSKEFIKNKHLIIIAVNDDKLTDEIKNDCEEEYKIFINCTDFKRGMGAIPVQKDLNNISFGLSTKQGNPKGALLAADLAFKSLIEIDDFIGFIGKLRENIKKLDNKKELINFIVSDDFKYFWNIGKDRIILNLFLTEDEVENLYDI